MVGLRGMRRIVLLLVVAVALLVAAPIWAPWVGIGPPDAPAPGRLVAVDLDAGHVEAVKAGCARAPTMRGRCSGQANPRRH